MLLCGRWIVWWGAIWLSASVFVPRAVSDGDSDAKESGTRVSQMQMQGQGQGQPQSQTQTQAEWQSVCAVVDLKTRDTIEWPTCEVLHPRHADVVTATATETTTMTPSATPNTGAAVSPHPSQTDQDLDTDSPLDNANFLSFEEWKKQNLAKVGQSVENVGGHRRSAGPPAGGSNRPTGINNALDSLGDDTEIELDFGGFGTDTSETSKPMPLSGTAVQSEASSPGVALEDKQVDVVADESGVPAQVPRKGPSRRKDAGTTCKERFNYASFDCAATVLKTNNECTGSSSVLIENKDSYMLNECRAKNKFLILELCDDILVDTIVLANYEFFSSIFHTFRVSVSDRYPAKMDQWKELGIYEARNTREVQAFAVENPLIWARYLKIEFLTHYGHEFYCPLSLIRVHGTTMMEEYKHDGDVGRVEEEVDVLEGASLVDNGSLRPTEPPTEGVVEPAPSREAWFQRGKEIEALLLKGPFDTCGIHATSAEAAGFGESAQPFDSLSVGVNVTVSSVAGDPTGSDGPVEATKVQQAHSTSSTATISQIIQQKNNTETETTKEETSASPPSSPSNPVTTPEAIRPTTTTTQAPSPNPTTQESFFKSVNKRLQMLESNSTLSLLYIEEQSRILRDAFSKVERRQLAKTSAFLENLNQTVLDELKQFRDQYDQVWKSVVLEFEHQRIQHHTEMYTLSGQLGILADELVFQKRVAVVQSIMVLVCFGVILFSPRGIGGSNGYIDLPSVQNIVSSRSYAQSVRSSSPTFGSPSVSVSPSSTRPTSSYRQHRRNASDDSRGDDGRDGDNDDDTPGDEGDAVSPTIAYSPPTPTSPSDRDGDGEWDGKRDRDALDLPAVESHVRSRSSPPVLNGCVDEEDLRRSSGES